MIFDTHAHFDDSRFNDDRDAVLNDLKNHNISYVLNAGCDLVRSQMSVLLAQKYDFMYASVGFHPHSAKDFKDLDLNLLKEMTNQKKVVAIGEIGLDYYYDNSPRDIQKQVFAKQLQLANKLNLPVIIHDRDAHKDCFDILQQHQPKKVVYHCFSGSLEYAKQLLQKGYFLSFGGAITFNNAKTSVDVIKNTPLEHMFLETDCPYLTPVPHRGKRNDSRYIGFVAEKIAEIKGISTKQVINQTTKNALEFFNIK